MLSQGPGEAAGGACRKYPRSSIQNCVLCTHTQNLELCFQRCASYSAKNRVRGFREG